MVLDANTKSMTLYAQWADSQGNAPPETGTTPENPVTVTVTGTDVNLREGPGTNYTRVGVANKGQQFVITQTASGSGYNWGKFDGGWIALQYTDYETVVNNQGSKPEGTTPETPTPPETTTPPTTQPPETQPPATEPPVTEPEKPKVTGTINVQEWLRVRSGPGTSYSVVGYLKPQQKVEILEQSTVGSMKWGKIAEGWISMDYVILDSNGSSNNNNSSATSWTGKVIADELLVRSGPGTNYSILGYLTEGTAVTITERQNGGALEWGKIDRGWICLNYVQLSGNVTTTPSAPSTPSTPDTTVTGYANVQDWLRIRTGPGTNYEIAGFLGPRERVTITERKKVGSVEWGKIANGWVSMDYIVIESSGSTSTTPAQPVTKTIVADCLRVRQGAGTSNTIVGFLYYGTKVQVLETKTLSNGEVWGRINSGWISMDYAK